MPHRIISVRSKHNLRFYAVKVLNKAKVVRTKQVQHTNNEREMLEAVQHPFIVNLWGTFQDPRNLYMVMDFVPGGELFTLLRRSNVSDPRSHDEGAFLTVISDRCSVSPIQSRNSTLLRSHLPSTICTP